MAEIPPVSGRDIIILSTQDWDALPTRKHRFARWFAQDGNRVLYVEQQMHWAGWFADIRHQFSRAWQFLRGPRPVAENLWVYTHPLVLPFFQMFAPLNWLNNLFLLPLLRWQARRLGFHDPILWTYTPHSADFIGRLGDGPAVYECVDDFTSSKGLIDPVAIGHMERQVIERVDLLVTTNAVLYEAKKPGAKRALLVPNGVDAEHFARAADPSLPVAEAVRDLRHPVIGWLGSLNYWIDTYLLARIARDHPEWTVLIVGPHDLLADLRPFEGVPNIVMTGRVPYEQMPSYVRVFDVCVNPYVMDGVAEHCSPLKLYEYIATGKPVVSVDMPEARKFMDFIAIAHTADEFVRLVEKAVSSTPAQPEQQIAEAFRHTWRSRYEQVAAALAEILSLR